MNLDYHNAPFSLSEMVDMNNAFWEQYHKKQNPTTMTAKDWQRILTCFRDKSGIKILMEGYAYFENRGTAHFPDNRKIAFELHDFDDEYLYGCLLYFVDCDIDLMCVLEKHNTRVNISLDDPHMPWLVEFEGGGQMRDGRKLCIQVLARPFMGYEMWY